MSGYDTIKNSSYFIIRREEEGEPAYFYDRDGNKLAEEKQLFSNRREKYRSSRLESKLDKKTKGKARIAKIYFSPDVKSELPGNITCFFADKNGHVLRKI